MKPFNLCLPRPGRWLLPVAALCFSFATAPARATEGNRPTIELRTSPPLARPSDVPGLCTLLAFPITDHWLVGGGYELVQDYDAILWTATDAGHKPVVMSGIRAGAWYRGGFAHQGFSWSVGGVLTYANPAISLARRPGGISNDTYVVDSAADFTVGHVWDSFRVEGFVTPAWSYGRIVSPAVGSEQRYNAFTYRFGVALAILVGS